MVGIMIYCMDDFYSMCLKEDSWEFFGYFDGTEYDVGVTCVGLFVGVFVFTFNIYAIQFNDS